MPEQKRALMIVTGLSLRTNSVRDHVDSFERKSKFQWSFVCWSKLKSLSKDQFLQEFSNYDHIVVHFSFRPAMGHVTPEFSEALKAFCGGRILMTQDEYQNLNITRQWIKDTSIDLVVTVVPKPYIRKVFPKKSVGDAAFSSVLTGYIPLAFENGHTYDFRQLTSRDVLCAYRGQALSVKLGDLARQKRIIADGMKKQLSDRNLSHDIEWESSKRVYANEWYQFIESSRWTLATESGANLFDVDGSFEDILTDAREKNENASYDELRKLLPKDENIGARMNQISPRIFEAICLRTGLVLFEGDYSGVVEADKHYLSLKHDFSNIDEIVERMQDDVVWEELTSAAYDHIFSNKANYYQHMVDHIDDAMGKISRQNKQKPRYRGIGDRVAGQLSQEIDTQYRRVDAAYAKSQETVDWLKEAIEIKSAAIETQTKAMEHYMDVAERRLEQIKALGAQPQTQSVDPSALIDLQAGVKLSTDQLTTSHKSTLYYQEVAEERLQQIKKMQIDITALHDAIAQQSESIARQQKALLHYKSSLEGQKSGP